MSRATRLLPLAGLVLAFLLINARWIWLYRHGLVLDIDEAGYLSLALNDYYALIYTGVPGWLGAVDMAGIQAPLVPAVTSLLFTLTGPHVIAGFAVPVAAGAGSVLATYALGRKVGSHGMALNAAILLACCPVIISYARSYQFSIPATLMTTMALLALLNCRHFRSVGWSLAFGVLLGLMPLTRTMTIAFLPGMLLAALAVLLADPLQRGRRFLLLVLSGLLGALTAASWFWKNGVLVANYLLGFGYGAHVTEYGKVHSHFGLDAWVATARLLASKVYLPHFILLLLGGALLVVAAARHVPRHGMGRTARRIFVSPTLPLAIFTACAWLVINSSSNTGSGFFAPVLPAMLILAAAGFEKMLPPFGGRIAVMLAAIIATLPQIGLHSSLAAIRVVQLPMLGAVTVTDGRGTIEGYESRYHDVNPYALQPISDGASLDWVAFSGRTAAFADQQFGRNAVLAFGFRNPLYNVNTVNLAQLLMAHNAFGVRMIDPLETGASTAGYLSWLNQQAADACLLLTASDTSGDFMPVIVPALMRQAANEAGFIVAATWPAPDGQTITIWRHRVDPPDCRAASPAAPSPP